MKKIILSIVLIFVAASSGFAIPAPQAQVEKMVNSVLSILRQADLTAAEKKAQVSGQVQEYLNMESMARRTLGSYWDGATEEQRQQFSDLFVQVLEGTYLNRIGDYSDGQVKFLKQRVKGHKAIVDTQILTADLEIPVQYKMIFADGRWQVFDLVIEGVSLIKNYRASYGEIIRRNGYDALLQLMEDKVKEMNATS